jgi:hypothetical protein
MLVGFRWVNIHLWYQKGASIRVLREVRYEDGVGWGALRRGVKSFDFLDRKSGNLELITVERVNVSVQCDLDIYIYIYI